MQPVTREHFKMLWAVLTVCFVLVMASHPKTVFDGASAGVQTWWNIVFPALLPFFIASELLMSFGVVRFMGVLLEPVMRPLFNVPGTGSFVVAVGFTSGYPIGAMLTAKLRSGGMVSRVEAERLVSFTNNSSPLFMLVAVAVGMFNIPALGYLIALCHYLGNITLGLLLRFYNQHDYNRTPAPGQGNWIRDAYGEMLRVLRSEQRPVGRIISDAVKNSIANLLNIGGFIILFAVIIRLLDQAGAIDKLAGFFSVFLIPFGFAPETMSALAIGLFEMTLGTRAASEAAAPLLQQIMAVAVILAWSGLSIQAQVVSMVSGTDIRLLPFFISRICHAALATFYTVLLFPLFNLESRTAAALIDIPVGNLLFHSSYLHYLQVSGFILLGVIIVPLMLHLGYGIVKLSRHLFQ